MRRATGSGSQRVAQTILHGLLRRIRFDRLTIRDGPRTCAFAGEPSAIDPLEATIVVHDRRAYTAVLTEGSIGLGRGYIEGWWTSPDPVAVVAVLIRNMAPIDALRNRWQLVTGPVTDRIRMTLPRHSRQRNRDDIAAHYDIGNEFFTLFLDETMTYSSAVFEELDGNDDEPLADASRRKYDLLFDKVGLDGQHHLLEIGTGWGGLALRAAQQVGCRVTTTTISAEQFREANRRVAAAGEDDRITVLDSDWRDLAGVYDRVISVEMIEAVDWRDYDAYFATIEHCLTPDGFAAIQAICLPDARWPRAKNSEDFIKRFVFPNGFLPSVAAISESVARATEMRIVGVEDFGPHYAETLRRWRATFLSRLDAVQALGLDSRFCRLWDFYLAYCEAAMRERHCTVVQIVLAGSAAPTRLAAEGRSRVHPQGSFGS